MFQPQHLTPPAVVSAQACWAPAATAATPDANPVGVTGTELDVSWPSPSCPSEPDPQHRTPPEVVSAQVNVPPTDAAFTPEERPATGTGVNVLDVPLPGIVPQHLRPPEVLRAQVRLPPAETAATFEESPDTATGVVLDMVVPVPSSPLSFLPQHFRALLGPVTAHVWPKPDEIENAVVGEAAAAAGAEAITHENAAAMTTSVAAALQQVRLVMPVPLLDDRVRGDLARLHACGRRTINATSDDRFARKAFAPET